MTVMANAKSARIGNMKNLGVWRPIDDCPNDNRLVLVISPGSMGGVNLMRADITRAHQVKYWTPIPAVPDELK